MQKLSPDDTFESARWVERGSISYFRVERVLCWGCASQIFPPGEAPDYAVLRDRAGSAPDSKHSRRDRR